jgi:hypothetical protein
MANEVMDNDGNGIPSFLTDDAGMGTEEVKSNTSIPELRVCTKMSRVFEDGKVDLGHIYNTDTLEDLGEKRQLLVFNYRVTFQCSNDNSTQIFCKSYDQETGLVRAYQEEDFDDEFAEEMNLTKEEVSGGDVGMVERKCNNCIFHPDNWGEEDDKNIPPRCKRSHEFYVLDLTDGFDKQPYMIRIINSSKLKNDVIKDWNNLIETKLKLNQAPIFGGVFEVYGNQKKNSMGGKNYVFGVDWSGYISPDQRKLYDFAKQSHIEFKKAEEENNRSVEEQAAASDDFDEDFEEGSAFDGDPDSDDSDSDDSVWPE